MSKYVKKADRSVQAALATLQNVLEDSNASQDQKQVAAMAVLEHNRGQVKVEPVRNALAEKTKLLRAAERDRDNALTELGQAKERVAVLEAVEQELTAAKTEITRLTTALNRAVESTASAQQRTATATVAADAQKRTVTAIVETLFPSDKDKRFGLGARLFFKHGGLLVAELYESLGVNLALWLDFDRRFRDRETMLALWECEELNADSKRFVSAKLQICFNCNVKDELAAREQDRQNALEAEKKAHRDWIQENKVKAVQQRKSDAMEARIREAEQPQSQRDQVIESW